MTEQDERKWRQMCNQAISENDLDKLLNIFQELDEVMVQEERSRSVPSTSTPCS